MIYKAILSEQIASIKRLVRFVADEDSLESMENFYHEVRVFAEHDGVDKERLSLYLEQLERILGYAMQGGEQAEHFARSFARQRKATTAWMRQSVRKAAHQQSPKWRC